MYRRSGARFNRGRIAAAAVASGSDVTAPTLSTAAIGAAGTTLVLTYNEALDAASVPALGAFSIAGTTLAALTGTPAVAGSAVTLTLSPAVASTETGITVSYTAGGSPIQDAAGNDAANLVAQAVTNNSTHAYDPRDEGGAVLWVDMQDASSFTQSAGTLTALTNKISGGSFTLVGSPIYSATGLNSKPTIDFGGATRYCHGNEAAVVAPGKDNNAATVVSVAAFDSIDGAVDILFAWANSGVASNGSRYSSEGTTLTGRMRAVTQNDAGTLVTVNGALQTDTTAHVYSCEWSGGLVQSEIDNVADIASTAMSPVTSTPDRYALGIRPDNIPDLPLAGRVSEHWVFSKQLSAAALTRVNAYLKAKWNTP